MVDGGPWKFYEDRVFLDFLEAEIDVDAHFIEDKLVKISLNWELNTTFGEIVEKVGEPDYIINVPLSGGLECLELLDKLCLYPQLGLFFVFDPGIYDQLIESGNLGQSLLYGEDIINNLRHRDGYGSIQEKYPPATRDITIGNDYEMIHPYVSACYSFGHFVPDLLSVGSRLEVPAPFWGACSAHNKVKFAWEVVGVEYAASLFTLRIAAAPTH
ncbi:MAG: hypothetical protein WA110_02720 [Anaerolineaceae bacterium]